MTGAFRVDGVDRLRSTLAAAADELGALQPTNTQVGRIVAAAAITRAPVRSGALVGSLRVRSTDAGTHITAGVPYAGPIHWGWPRRHIRAQPFLSDAATTSESTWLDLYAAAVLDAVEGVKGT